jgi:hypothetical protein
VQDYQTLKAQHAEQATQLTGLQIALERKTNELQDFHYEE